MKSFCFIVIAVWCSWMVHAQTDATAQSSPAGATTHSPDATRPPRAPTRIDSDNSADFDLNGHQAIYRGHVRVDHPAAQHSNHYETETFHCLVFINAPFSNAVCALFEMVRNESLCRHKKPSPSTRNFPSPVCNCKGPAELAVPLIVL